MLMVLLAPFVLLLLLLLGRRWAPRPRRRLPRRLDGVCLEEPRGHELVVRLHDLLPRRPVRHTVNTRGVVQAEVRRAAAYAKTTTTT